MSRRSGRSKPYAYDDPETKRSDENSPEIDEQEEVTRCICGQDELSTINAQLQSLLAQEYRIKIDTGLFIQCDKCLVWQHGYCVGLFINEDVPDKYWCELCKPDLHRFVQDGSTTRTLYRPVNDSRTRLIEEESEEEDKSEKEKSDKSDSKSDREKRRRRSPDTPELASRDSEQAPTRQSRKERRHGEDFDEQLQKALRESARTSGVKRPGDLHPGTEKRPRTEELDNEVDESNVDEDSEAVTKRENRVRPRARPKPKPRAAPKGRTTPKNDDAAMTKDELLNQQSRPRFVNDKSSIYELRKRTGAILEWLGRTQMELEEERDVKLTQFMEAAVATGMVTLFDENLTLMEQLTEKILGWEQKFGKYAP